MRFRWIIFYFALIAGSHALFGQLAGTNPIARFHTDFGDMDVYLLSDTNIAPKTVTNFLKYANRGDYDNSFIHRSPAMFVVQGGGYKLVNGQLSTIPADSPILSEFHVSNTRGTIAMALGSFQNGQTNPDSATTQWFFNESDSNAFLDAQKFTVFGRLTNSASLTAMDTIAALPVCHNTFAPPFDDFPLLQYDCNAHPTIMDSNLVHVIWIKVVPQIVAITRTNATTIHIQGRGVASTTYKLQSSSSPNASSFTNLANATTGTQGNFNNDDTSAGTKKFYRLVIP